MTPFFEDLLDRFHELHADIGKALDELPQAALDWKPGEDMNSLCVLVVHATGAERFLIGDVVMGDPSNRNREIEFQATGLDVNTLKSRLIDADAYARTAFETLNLQDLEMLRRSPRDGHKLTVAWALTHALEHTAIHLGHIQMISQLWMQKYSKEHP